MAVNIDEMNENIEYEVLTPEEQSLIEYEEEVYRLDAFETDVEKVKLPYKIQQCIDAYDQGVNLDAISLIFNDLRDYEEASRLLFRNNISLNHSFTSYANEHYELRIRFPYGYEKILDNLQTIFKYVSSNKNKEESWGSDYVYKPEYISIDVYTSEFELD